MTLENPGAFEEDTPGLGKVRKVKKKQVSVATDYCHEDNVTRTRDEDTQQWQNM